jgi:4-methyl-5(b-hydroxyethyl)-thiazole monophosphate biosynthesis
MQLRALILLHPGFEELEAVAPIDLLARAEIKVTQASTSSSLNVTGRNGITLTATHLLSDVAEENYDVVILPGGPGIMQLRRDAQIIACLQRHHLNNKWVACICAAPLLLLDAGLTKALEYTAHPSTAEELGAASSKAVVIDGHIITSRGAGTATEFALAIVTQVRGLECAQAIARSICWTHSVDISQ